MTSSIRVILSYVAVIISPLFVQAQVADRCGTMEAVNQRMITDPSYALYRNAAINMNKVSASAIPCNGTNSIIVPVAFHFDESFSCTDISCIETEVADQMTALNLAFGDNTAASTTQVAACPSAYVDGAGNSVVSTGTCISFCYATPPVGNSQGLQDCDLPITIDEFNGGTNGGGIGAPGWGGIMNIFITNDQCLGVADGIPGAGNGDGVTVCGAGFGGFGGASPSCGSGLDDNGTYNLGATLVHEIGHYLGLYHTFQGGCGTQEENPPGPIQVLDTPPASAPYYGCNSTSCEASSCSGGNQAIANFMDYTNDACMTMFTEDQAAVMNYWANQLFGASSSQCSAASNIVSCGTTTATCAYTADFEPASGETFNICLDTDNTINLADLSAAAPVNWNWSISSVSGNLVYSPTSSSTQNPVLTFTAGSSGVLSISLTSCDINGTCESVTHTITVNLLSGAACPSDCNFDLTMSDTYGDGWNGASIEIFENGTSIGVYTHTDFGQVNSPSTETVSVAIQDGATINVVYTTGQYDTEVTYSFTNPQGVVQLADGPSPSGGSFTADCAPAIPSCTDGIQNQDETDVDCGGTICPACPTCSDGIQNQDELGVDCGGASCPTCPACVAGETTILNENFDSCSIPAGWTTTHTNTNGGNVSVGSCTDGTSFFQFDCTSYPSGSSPGNPSFSGCVATMDDDNPGSPNDPDGIGCIVSPMVDLSVCNSATLTFDWEHRAFGGSELYTEITADGSTWTSVQSSIVTGSGSESIPVAGLTGVVQVRFCLNDNNGWQYGAAIDNVIICADCGPVCPDSLQLSNAIPDDHYKANLIIRSDGKVPSGGDVIMEAGQEIELQSDFEAHENSDLDVHIGGCP